MTDSIETGSLSAWSYSNGLGTAAVRQLQIGDISPGRTFDLAFDDVAVG